jgi:hypothetical protein
MEQIIPDFKDAIILPDGTKIGWLPKKASSYLCMTTTWFGSTKSGKTTCILEGMYNVKNDISRTYIFSGSESSNHNYSNRSPPRSIKTKITFDYLISIYTSAMDRMEAYGLAHNPVYLRKVIDLLRDQSEYSDIKKTLEKINRYKTQQDISMRIFESQHPGDMSAIGENRENMEKMFNKTEVELLRRIIKSNYHAIKRVCDQSKNDREKEMLLKLVRKLDINPYSLVIFDDCMTNLKAVSKYTKIKGEKVNLVHDMWVQGRHHGITIFNACQDDAQMDKTLRINTFLSIFTDAQCCEHYIYTKTNGLSKVFIERMKMAINTIYRSKGDKYKHVKLVYYKEGNEVDNSSIMVTKANLYDTFKVGDDLYWKTCAIADKHQNRNELEVLNRV